MFPLLSWGNVRERLDRQTAASSYVRISAQTYVKKTHPFGFKLLSGSPRTELAWFSDIRDVYSYPTSETNDYQVAYVNTENNNVTPTIKLKRAIMLITISERIQFVCYCVHVTQYFRVRANHNKADETNVTLSWYIKRVFYKNLHVQIDIHFFILFLKSK